jgi:hypothetical protein
MIPPDAMTSQPHDANIKVWVKKTRITGDTETQRKQQAGKERA